MQQGMHRLMAAAVVAYSGASCADFRGSIGLASEYMYRGYEQSLGAAVLGTAEWRSAESGLHAGAFMANNEALGGNEIDWYGGWRTELFDALQLELGGIYYQFSEDRQSLGYEADYFEVFAGLSFGGAAARLYYTPEYLSDESQEAYYLYADYAVALSETVTLKPQAGYSYGDGFEALTGMEHLYDYGLHLLADIGKGYSVSFSAVDSTLPGDAVKLVAGITRSFEF